MESGYIKLHRKLFDWEWFDDLVVYKLFTGMLLLANWKEGKFRGEVIPCGSFVSSVRRLAETLKLSKGQVERGLNKLKAGHEVTIEARHKYSIYTIVNYSTYQESQDAPRDSEQDATRDVSRDTSGTLTETQAEDNRRSKEIKKGRNKKIVKKFEPPTFEEFAAYCEENDFGHISRKAYDYYTAGGWKDGRGAQVKNWKQKLRGVWFDESKNPKPNKFITGAFPGSTTRQQERSARIDERTRKMMEKFGGRDDTTQQATDDSARFVEAAEVFSDGARRRDF